jgi:FKBP-type peptidyl-prolyl cis-trans isomerase SlyD
MEITKDRVVSFDYTLTDDEGQVLDSSEGRDPLSYLHGSGSIIPGLESELEGKVAGDQFELTVDPPDGYGEQNDSLQQNVPREQFADVDDLEVGMQFRVPAEDGSKIVITVIELGDEEVTIDGRRTRAWPRLWPGR